METCSKFQALPEEEKFLMGLLASPLVVKTLVRPRRGRLDYLLSGHLRILSASLHTGYSAIRVKGSLVFPMKMDLIGAEDGLENGVFSHLSPRDPVHFPAPQARLIARGLERSIA